MINAKLGLFVVLIAYSITMRSQTPDSWTRVADYPGTPNAGGIAFSIDSFGYVGACGYYSIDSFPYPITYSTDFWQYNPSTNSWMQKANFPGVGRADGVFFIIGSKVYVGLGKNTYSGALKDFWEYDPATDVWTQKANFQGAWRSGGEGFSVGNKGYVAFGSTDTLNYMKDIWEYDPSTNTWAQKADFPGGPRIGGVVLNIRGDAYAGLGYGPNNSDYYLNDLWKYDTLNDSWTQRADFTGVAREVAFDFVINSKGYIGTGVDSSNTCRNDFWEYNSLTDQWIEKDTFGGGTRGWGVGFSIGNKGYAGIGASPDLGHYHNDFWQYTPDSIATGIKDIDMNSISIYPDPAIERVTINNLPHDASLTITDMTGRICITPTGSDIDVSALPAGVYCLRIQDSGGTAIRKFVKE